MTKNHFRSISKIFEEVLDDRFFAHKNPQKYPSKSYGKKATSNASEFFDFFSLISSITSFEI